jgi:branched-chain amino acid transport system substrate-binding protein
VSDRRASTPSSGGAASSLRFIKEFPEAAEGVMDCNHWHNPKDPGAHEVLEQAETEGRSYVYNAPVNYAAVRLVAQAIEKAGSGDHLKLIEVLSTQSFDSSVMPYGQSKFVDGQNINALALNTQVQGGDVKAPWSSRRQ